MMIGKPGIYHVPLAIYHADLLQERPSLSASIAHTIVAQSPLHAKFAHPRLSPNYKPTNKKAFDLGTAAHRVLLEGTAEGLVVLDYPHFKSKAAQEERDAAYDEGLTPLLTHEWENLQAMVSAVSVQIAEHTAQPPLLADGKPERTLVWYEDGFPNRARLDWLRDDLTAVCDLKTTSRSADPDTFSRNLYALGYDLKAAFYLRGLKAITGADAEFRWIVAETTAPYAVSVVSPAPALLEIADAKVDYALALWRKCVESNEWPAYRQEVAYAEPPAWAEMQWLEQEAREAA